MSNNQKAPRSTRDYVKLNRWVISNHLKTEKTKEKVAPDPNLITRFLHHKIFSWIYHYVKSRFVPRHKFMTYPKGGEDRGIYKMRAFSGSGPITVALASDWATDTTESRQIGASIKNHCPDYSIHLGDTYFVGTPEEMERNFQPDSSSWPYGKVGSFALAGNHEMYSNGNPYFDTLLKWMGIYFPKRIIQKTSYICLENGYWRIIGLDTGFRSVSIPFLETLISKSDLRSEELEWLTNDLKIDVVNKGLLFLTHHQPISAFSRGYPSAGRQLGHITGPDRKALWFWGHEHRFAIYGKNSFPGGITFYGRCIGHGGMPIELEKNPEKVFPEDKNLVLYDNRLRKEIENTGLGYNGYALLRIDEANLVIEYHDEQQHILSEKWFYNIKTQCIEGVDIEIHNGQLEMIKNINQAIN